MSEAVDTREEAVGDRVEASAGNAPNLEARQRSSHAVVPQERARRQSSRHAANLLKLLAANSHHPLVLELHRLR